MDPVIPPGPLGAPGTVTPPPLPPPTVTTGVPTNPAEAPAGTPNPAFVTTPPVITPTPNFFDGFTDPSVKEYIGKKGYADPEALAKAYVNLERLHAGATDIVGIPAPDAKPEVVDAFERKLGRPAEAKDYKFEFPEGFKPDPSMEEFGRDFFFKAGIPQAKVQQALAGWEAYVAKETARREADSVATNKTALETTKAGWTGNFDADMAAGQNIVKAIGLDANDMAALEAAVGAAPIAKMFGKIGQKLSSTAEFKTVIGSITAGNPLASVESSRAEIARLATDPAHQAALWDGRHPGHAAALALQDSLYLKSRAKA